jgi:hypothetical protein
MLRTVRELIRGLKVGMHEFHRSSEEIQDEMRNAIEVRPMDEADRRLVRAFFLGCTLLGYTLLCLALFRSP